MAKKKKNNKRKGFTIPLAVVGGFGAGLYRVHTAGVVAPNYLSGASSEMAKIYTGYNPFTGKFNAADLRFGLMPVAVGGLVHKFIGGKLGINRMLAAMGFPYLRV